MAERKHNIPTLVERIEWQTAWRRETIINFGVGKMQIQEVAKRETKVDVNISTMFSESCFFGNAAKVGLRCSVLNGESADVPEVAAFPAVCNGYPGTPRKPFSV